MTARELQASAKVTQPPFFTLYITPSCVVVMCKCMHSLLLVFRVLFFFSFCIWVNDLGFKTDFHHHFHGSVVLHRQ